MVELLKRGGTGEVSGSERGTRSLLKNYNTSS